MYDVGRLARFWTNAPAQGAVLVRVLQSHEMVHVHVEAGGGEAFVCRNTHRMWCKHKKRLSIYYAPLCPYDLSFNLTHKFSQFKNGCLTVQFIWQRCAIYISSFQLHTIYDVIIATRWQQYVLQMRRIDQKNVLHKEFSYMHKWNMDHAVAIFSLRHARLIRSACGGRRRGVVQLEVRIEFPPHIEI